MTKEDVLKEKYRKMNVKAEFERSFPGEIGSKEVIEKEVEKIVEVEVPVEIIKEVEVIKEVDNPKHLEEIKILKEKNNLLEQLNAKLKKALNELSVQ